MLGDDSLNVDSDRDMCMGSSCESPRPPLLAGRGPSAERPQLAPRLCL